MEEEYKKELKTIRNYLAWKPNTPKFKVAAETGISLDIIIKLIEQGLLTEEEGELKTSKTFGRINGERRKLVQGLREGIEFEKIGVQRTTEEKSKLLIDLENKKTDIDSNGWEH